jgi:hypothetical protein
VKLGVNAVIALFNINLGDDNLNVDQLGFGIMPLTMEEGFVHGVFQIPIYNEPISYSILTMLQKMDGWNMIKLVFDKQAKSQKPPDLIQSSFLVRVMPKEIYEMYNKRKDIELINKMFMPADV